MAPRQNFIKEFMSHMHEENIKTPHLIPTQTPRRTFLQSEYYTSELAGPGPEIICLLEKKLEKDVL